MTGREISAFMAFKALLKHLSLAQRYLERANREVAFSSPCSLQGCLHYGEQGHHQKLETFVRLG